jgi:DNA-binding MarR family transcriptional regulator
VKVGKAQQLEAWRLFLEAHASLTRILERELMDECQLPLTWYDVLIQLERRACPEDRRGTFVVLTDGGKDVLRNAAPIHLAGVEKHFADRLTEADTRALTKAFGKLG